VVEFERVWWDKYAKHPSDQGVSFWRPKAPPGYVALGDVVSAGRYAPPCEVRGDTGDRFLWGDRFLSWSPAFRVQPQCHLKRWTELVSASLGMKCRPVQLLTSRCNTASFVTCMLGLALLAGAGGARQWP
jgi:hypothetical protein